MRRMVKVAMVGIMALIVAVLVTSDSVFAGVPAGSSTVIGNAAIVNRPVFADPFDRPVIVRPRPVIVNPFFDPLFNFRFFNPFVFDDDFFFGEEPFFRDERDD